MSVNKENYRQQNYRVKLLADNNVVLVEADKYESEIFTPQIVNGRITFLNIIPNRRCCQVAKTNVMNFPNIATQEPGTYLKNQNIVKSRRFERLSAGQSPTMSVPLANSTPLGVKQKSSFGSRSSNYNSYNSADFTLPTPEHVRKAVPARPMMEPSMLGLPKGVKVTRIYPNPAKDTPKNIGRIVPSSIKSNGTRDSVNDSILNASFRLLFSPSTSSHSKSRKPDVSAGTYSISRWQKVLTPVRTYTRNSNNGIMVRRPVLVNSAKKPLKTSKYKPTYLVNPTKGPNVTQRIEFKKRRIIIDTKICISPRSFKKQQNVKLHGNTSKSAAVYPNSLTFHKPLPYLHTMKMSAFDLLTNSNRNRMMAAKLNEQFRKGCVNKAMSTYSKYKLLSTVPPLQQDDQVLEMSRISLQN